MEKRTLSVIAYQDFMAQIVEVGDTCKISWSEQRCLELIVNEVLFPCSRHDVLVNKSPLKLI